MVTTPELEVFLSDIHVPFEDKIAVAFTLKIIKKLQPDLVWLGGDIVDFMALSRWDKSPRRKLMLQEELDATVILLEKLRTAAPRAQMVWMDGNHEHRLEKYLLNKAEEFAYLRALELPYLLDMDKLEIKYVGHGKPQKVGHLYHLHGDEFSSGSTNIARGQLMKLQKNAISGHNHRHQNDYQRDVSGKIIGSWKNGCLCGLQPEYDIAPNWTQGITVIQYSTHGSFHVSQLVYFPAERQPGRLACVVGGEMMLSDK